MPDILVVDDEREIADLVGVYLRHEAFTVRTAATAARQKGFSGRWW